MSPHKQQRSHLFTVRMDPVLFDAVREALAIDYPPMRPRDRVAPYAWSNLIHEVLTDWLVQHHTQRSLRSTAADRSHCD